MKWMLSLKTELVVVSDGLGQFSDVVLAMDVSSMKCEMCFLVNALKCIRNSPVKALESK